jgi:hypothetical protein
MADDAIMFSSLLVVLVQDEELEELLIDVNVFQRPCEKKLIEKVVCIRMVQLV